MFPQIEGGTQMQQKNLVVHVEKGLRTLALDRVEVEEYRVYALVHNYRHS